MLGGVRRKATRENQPCELAYPSIRTHRLTALLTLLPLLLAAPAAAAPRWLRATAKVAGHLTIGAATEIGVSQAAGGAEHWPAGLLAAGAVAGFKEGSDAVSGRDTRKQAVWHALTIVAGAGISAAAWHRPSAPPPRRYDATCDLCLRLGHP